MMSKPRQPKWDWHTHFPRMDELYRKGKSIPDICKAIQCEGFTPSQRAVYDRFQYEGYPTDQAGRSRFLRARSSTVQEEDGTVTVKSEDVPALPTNELVLRPGPPPPGIVQLPTTRPSILSGPVFPAPGHEFNDFGISWLTNTPKQVGADSMENLDFISFGSQGGTQHCNDIIADVLPGTRDLQHEMLKWEPASENLTLGNAQGHKKRVEPKKAERDRIIISNLQKLGFIDNPEPNQRRKAGSCNNHDLKRLATDNLSISSTGDNGSPSRPNQGGDPAYDMPRVATPLYKVRGLFKPKSNHLQVNEKRYSQSTFDSGYYSGRASLSTLPVSTIHPDSLNEFQGLYRVACHSLHEPELEHLNQYKEVQTCDSCGYSSIHNLAWSARHLKLEVFLAELKLENVYDFEAIDAAGNSALHFAAASGAGFSYLKALIEAGVNPSQRNTANQTFLHWLRPYKPSFQEKRLMDVRHSMGVESQPIEKPGFDCFNLDLINLLSLVPERLLMQQDNDGVTVLHTLAAQISHPQQRAQVFEFFRRAGCSTTIPDRFGRTAKDFIPKNDQFMNTTVDLAAPTRRISVHETAVKSQAYYREAPPTPVFEVEYQKQLKAHHIIEKACEVSPRYVDDETGDTVLNALARVNPHNLDVLDSLRLFVERDADLNRHNHEGNHPLASFTSERPFETEPGARKAMYLDALLWKDQKRCIPTGVNVDMKNREGETALHNAAVRARDASVQSLIDAGANVNARLDYDGDRLSVLRATLIARDTAVIHNDQFQVGMFKEVISRLVHAGAVENPTSLQERGFGCAPSPRQSLGDSSPEF